MKFEHAADASYADVASGAVLHSAPGFPSFPARLALELFDRARQLCGREHLGLWDPACGAGGLITTLALLRRQYLSAVRAGDVDSDAVALARRNLALTTTAGLDQRIEALRHLAVPPERLKSAERLASMVTGAPPLPITVDRTDATQPHPAVPDIDVVITDLPYGSQAHWSSSADAPAEAMLENLLAALPAHAVVVLVSTDRHGLPRGLPARRAFKHGRRHIKVYCQPGS